MVVEFATEDGPLRAVDSVSFAIGRGEIVGLVGESGAGKTLTAEAILRPDPLPARRASAARSASAGTIYWHSRSRRSPASAARTSR